MPTPPSDTVRLVNLDIKASILSTKPLPFVVKVFLAGSGYDTHIIKTGSLRQVMLAAMVKYRSRGETEILLSEYINFNKILACISSLVLR